METEMSSIEMARSAWRAFQAALAGEGERFLEVPDRLGQYGMLAVIESFGKLDGDHKAAELAKRASRQFALAAEIELLPACQLAWQAVARHVTTLVLAGEEVDDLSGLERSWESWVKERKNHGELHHAQA